MKFYFSTNIFIKDYNATSFDPARMDRTIFDPDRFHERFGRDLGGAVCKSRTGILRGKMALRAFAWRSNVTVVEAANWAQYDTEFLKYLHYFRPALKLAHKEFGLRIFINVRQGHRNYDDISGIFLPLEVIKLLGEIKAEFCFEPVLKF